MWNTDTLIRKHSREPKTRVAVVANVQGSLSALTLKGTLFICSSVFRHCMLQKQVHVETEDLVFNAGKTPVENVLAKIIVDGVTYLLHHVMAFTLQFLSI